MRVWAGDKVKFDELKGDAMDGSEADFSADKDRPKGNGRGTASLGSQSMDLSGASASGVHLAL
jgi:hypothetical protein